jgi:hypothetical protein
VAVSVADKRLADQAAQQMRSRGTTSAKKPDVRIGGFPFLTQVLAGEYQKVTIDVDHPRNDRVALEHLTLTANQVHAPLNTIMSGSGQVTADSVRGAATIGWDQVRNLVDTTPLSQVPGLDLSKLNVAVKNDKLTMSAPVALLGLRMTMNATGTLAVTKGEVRLQIEDLGLTTAGGGTNAVSHDFIDRYKSLFNVKIAVPSMPYDLVVDNVQTSPSGIMVIATASNVVLAGKS